MSDINVDTIRKEALAIREKEGKNKEPSAAQKKTYERLLKAHTSFMETVEAAIWKGIKDAFVHDPMACDTVIVNPHKNAKLENYHFLTILHGFYDDEKKFYKRSVHHAAGIRYDPLTELRLKLEPAGIIDIENLSDKKKGHNLILKISFEFTE